jgi:hypothetical protein
VTLSSSQDHLCITSFKIEANIDKVAVIIETNIKVAQEYLTKAVLLELVVDTLEPNEALAFTWKLVKISFGTNLEFRLAHVEAYIWIGIIQYFTRILTKE